MKTEAEIRIEEPGESESRADLKSLLLAMPDVGEDADFARKLDYGRESVAWDS